MWCKGFSPVLRMVELTERQAEIKTLAIDRGHKYQLVAEWLGVSFKTVDVHVTRIRRKYARAGMPLPDKRRHFVNLAA